VTTYVDLLEAFWLCRVAAALDDHGQELDRHCLVEFGVDPRLAHQRRDVGRTGVAAARGDLVPGPHPQGIACHQQPGRRPVEHDDHEVAEQVAGHVGAPRQVAPRDQLGRPHRVVRQVVEAPVHDHEHLPVVVGVGPAARPGPRHRQVPGGG
jgi:hypothetical protein